MSWFKKTHKRKMAPVQAHTPKDTRALLVGATKDGFGMLCENGDVYGWNTYYTGLQKAHRLNLTRIPNDKFEGLQVSQLGGKYGNKYALAA